MDQFNETIDKKIITIYKKSNQIVSYNQIVIINKIIDKKPIVQNKFLCISNKKSNIK